MHGAGARSGGVRKAAERFATAAAERSCGGFLEPGRPEGMSTEE